MYVKRSSVENYFLFPYQQTQKQFFPDFSSLENDQIFCHTFQDSVGTLTLTQYTFYIVRSTAYSCIRPTKWNVTYTFAWIFPVAGFMLSM